jgi:hypothetical protein
MATNPPLNNCNTISFKKFISQDIFQSLNNNVIVDLGKLNLDDFKSLVEKLLNSHKSLYENNEKYTIFNKTHPIFSKTSCKFINFI